MPIVSLIPLRRKLIFAHVFIRFFTSIISSSSSISTKLSSVTAFTSKQHRFRSLLCIQLRKTTSTKKPYMHTSTKVTNFSPTMMSQTTAVSEVLCSESKISQLRQQRPELVLSVRHHLQSVNETTDNGTDESSKVQLVLASSSPRRREIFDMMGLQNKYVVTPSPLNETQIQIKLRSRGNDTIDPIVYVRTLAEQKAYAVAYEILSKEREQLLQQDLTAARTTTRTNTPSATLIVGSDTVVALPSDSYNNNNNNKGTENATAMILEKPNDSTDAIRMLQQLQNRSHVVYTGVAVVRFLPTTTTTTRKQNEEKSIVVDGSDGYLGDTLPSIQLVSSLVETAVVNVAAMTDADIQSYVATKEPMDKAGAYGIQGIGGQMVTHINGDFFTVMGLPMHQTSRALASAIIDIVDQV